MIYVCVCVCAHKTMYININTRLMLASVDLAYASATSVGATTFLVLNSYIGLPTYNFAKTWEEPVAKNKANLY